MHMPKATSKSITLIYSEMNARQQSELRDFIHKTLQKRSRSTPANWIAGRSLPSALEQKAIADYLSVPVKGLFKSSK